MLKVSLYEFAELKWEKSVSLSENVGEKKKQIASGRKNEDNFHRAARRVGLKLTLPIGAGNHSTRLNVRLSRSRPTYVRRP